MASVSEELERLFSLFEKGAITREQFEAKRDRLMAEDEAASTRRTSASSPGVPNQVGAYRILGHIGDGGMGSVYRGQHRNSEFAAKQGGEVAIKVMHPHVARNEDFAERFEREAGLGLKLDHPGICKVHELIVDGGMLALVMELLDGDPLSDIIGSKTGPIPWERAWPMFEQLLESVAYMHGRGVLHRDIKPENVLVTSAGRLKLLDLGIAKDTGSGQTKTGVGMGTVDYMAPEQHTDAGKVDERADVYGLGMTLYEMLAGRLPWGDEIDALGILQNKLSGKIPPPTDFYPDISPQVVAALMAALATEREARTNSATALAAALQEASARAQELQLTANHNAQQQGDGSEARPGPTVQSDLAPPAWVKEVSDQVVAGRKIQAIKVLRDNTGMGLKEAHESVESGVYWPQDRAALPPARQKQPVSLLVGFLLFVGLGVVFMLADRDGGDLAGDESQFEEAGGGEAAAEQAAAERAAAERAAAERAAAERAAAEAGAAEEWALEGLSARELAQEGRTSRQSGNLARAQAAYEKLIATFPKDRMARNARAQLDSIRLVGKPAPGLQIEEWLGNDPGSISDLNGKPVMLVFWATWCPHCRREMPRIEKTWQRYKDDGLMIIAVTRNSRGQTTDKVREYIGENGLTLPIGIDLTGNASKSYSVTGIPAAALIDKTGKVVVRDHPTRITDEVIKQYL